MDTLSFGGVRLQCHVDLKLAVDFDFHEFLAGTLFGEIEGGEDVLLATAPPGPTSAIVSSMIKISPSNESSGLMMWPDLMSVLVMLFV